MIKELSTWKLARTTKKRLIPKKKNVLREKSDEHILVLEKE